VPRRRPKKDLIVLTDPKALRALAHPARAAALDELYQGNVRTSSELAALTGLTPSAMSYHLRALEKWGIVRRAADTGDGRERPWEASGRGFSFAGRDAGSAAGDAIVGIYLDRLRDDLAAWRRDEHEAPEAWRDRDVINRGFPWMTPEELTELTTAVHDMVERIAGDRTPDDHPAEARRVAYFFAAVPVSVEGDTVAYEKR
jgi:DNA-binding transcriptional ArsR family regulator